MYWALATIAVGLGICVLAVFVGTRAGRVLLKYPEPRSSPQDLLEQHPMLGLPPLLVLLGVRVLVIGLAWLAIWLLLTALL